MSALSLSSDLDDYRKVHAIDSEYTPRRGQLPDGICYAEQELRSGAPILSRWVKGQDPGPCPYDPDDPHTLVVSYSVAAELSFFLACGWRLPLNVLDLWIAFRIFANGRLWHSSMLDALRAFGIAHDVNPFDKERMQQICARGGPDVLAQAREIMAYCASDIADLGALIVALAREVALGPIIEFGRYIIHAALVEQRGIPIDVPRHQLMSGRWDEAERATVVRANARMSYRVYGGPGRHHLSRSYDQIAKLFRYRGLDTRWPRTETGQLALDKKTLKDLEGRHPCIAHLRQAEKMLHMAHPSRIAVGPDGRCRTPIRAFAAITSRSQSRAETPLAFAGGMCALIVPRERAMIVADYSQADPGAAAAMAKDQAMLADYFEPRENPDFYIACAVRFGVLPRGTTKAPEHEAVRGRFKRITCGTMYGSGAFNLSMMMGVEHGHARAMIRRFASAYPDYWRWAACQRIQARLDGFLFTESGWVEHNVQGPAAQNFPVQAVVADVLRLASLMLDKLGIPVIFPLHDSLGVEVPAVQAKECEREVVRVMGDASERILGIRLRVSSKIVLPGERYYKDSPAQDWWVDISRMLGLEP